MDVKQGILRLAAATAVTVFMTVGVVGPVHATDGKGTDKSASSQRGNHTQDTDSTTDDSTTDESTGSDHTEGNASTTGEYNEPQPESTADQNDGGANAGDCDEGPEHNYCSTRDGSASENGKGDGKATGKPCAGCVGKADNKNPKGQYPDGSDRNAGYECDRNQGIGKGNPAHTGCTSEEQAATVCPEDSEMNEAGECVVPAEEVTCPEDSTMNDEGKCVVPTEEEQTCPQGATKSDEGECIVPAEEVVCPDDATMSDEGECIVPALPSQAGPAEVGPNTGNEVLGAEEERASTAVAGASANRAAALVAPVAGILPATGAGAYGPVIIGGIVLLVAGGVLLARKRPQAKR